VVPDEHQINLGKEMSAETKQKIGNSLRKRWEKNSHPNIGRKHSPETIAKRISTIRKNRTHCKNGHLLSETGFVPKGHPNRVGCRECNRMGQQKIRARRRANNA